MLLQIAWRNIWRNTRRTAVILTAIVIGVWTMIVAGSLMRGVASGMVRNAIATLTGEIQIHAEGYRRDPVIDNRMESPEQVNAVLKDVLPDGAAWTARVRVNAVASNARNTAGVTLVGIDPEQEAAVSFMGPDVVVEGHYLSDEDVNGIIAGQALVEDFETRLGNKLVLMSQAADGEVASRAFRIVGIYQGEMEATEKQFVFVLRSSAREMLHLGDGISEYSMILPEGTDVKAVAEALRETLPERYAVHTWHEILSAIHAYLQIFDGFVFIWYLVIFIAMGFGIVNTLLMAVFERMREFGVLKALGMKPWWIIRQVVAESFFLLVIGTVLGNALALLTVLLLSRTGIDLTAFAAGAEFAGISRVIYPDLRMRDMAGANLVVFVLGLLISLYPAVKAARFTPVEAMARE